MEEFTTLFDLIVWPYLILFMLLSYLVKTYLGELLQKITKFEWKTAYTVLIIAAVLAVPYAIVEEKSWLPMLITYTVGTSFHEILLKYLIEGLTDMFKKIFGIK